MTTEEQKKIDFSKKQAIKGQKKGRLLRKKVGQILRKKILENGQKPSIKQAMIEAGYTPLTANAKAGMVLQSREVQEQISDLEQKIDEVIDLSIEQAKKKVDDANYRDAVYGVDTLTKTKQQIRQLVNPDEQKWYTDDQMTAVFERLTIRKRL